MTFRPPRRSNGAAQLSQQLLFCQQPGAPLGQAHIFYRQGSLTGNRLHHSYHGQIKLIGPCQDNHADQPTTPTAQGG
jgi:hypothetical protein